MKKRIIWIVLALLIVAFMLTACDTEDVVKLLDEFGRELPAVEVTGLEDVDGTVEVNFVSAEEKETAMAAVKDVYYVAEGATTYAVDVSIVKDGQKVEVGKQVSVSIELKEHALPLDQYVVFHVHDGKADQIVPRVDGRKLVVTVESFSPFIVVPAHEHQFGEWTFIDGEPACDEVVLQKRTCACGHEETRDYFGVHVDADNDGVCDKCGASLKEGGNGETGKPDEGGNGGSGTVNPDGSTGEGGTTGHNHEFGAWEAVRKPTCTEEGLAERKCKCGYTETKVLEALGGEHVDQNKDGKCDKCQESMPTSGETGKPDDETKPGESGKPDDGGSGGSIAPVEIPETYVRDGNVLYFGAYPQTRMTDETLISALNELAGAFPGRTEDEFNGWTSYKYYRGTNNKENPPTNEYDFMFYKDVTYNGSTYRGVYMTAYRPNVTIRMGTTDNTFQDDNGYQFGKGVSYLLYWFKFEPIQWRILEERDGVALVIAQLIIDSQAYLNVAEYTGLDDHSNEIDMNTNPGVPENTYANNYEYSSIRAWLNDNFYNTAFTTLQKELIALTNVDNGINSSSTSYTATDGKNQWVAHWNTGTDFLCANTEDYVFLPSLAEITNADYGFTPCYTRYAEDTNRIRLYSDYALSQGLWAHSGSYTNGVKYGEYWLRTPYQSDYDGSGYGAVCTVDEEGTAEQSGYVCWTAFGVVPMLWITLE